MVQGFTAGDKVRVEYRYREYFEGTVLWTERYSGLDWVTVRPDEEKMIYTFGSSRDMDLGYKAYIANDPILGKVTKLTETVNYSH
jgi:hypothetical protein